MLRDLSLHQLTVVRAVARHLNFTRAAEELHLSQPAVSRQVSQLERALDVTLFARRGRRVYLTDAGRELLGYAERVFSVLAEMEEAFGARKGLRRGSLRLIATSTAGEFLLPPLVAGFLREHPGVLVSLRVANREQVLRALDSGEADLAVMGRPPAEQDWAWKGVLANELVAIAAPDHPLATAGAKPIASALLTGETFFLRESGSGTRLAAESFLHEKALAVQTVELGSDGAIKQAVMAGLGIAILSRQALDLELAVGRLSTLPISGLPLRRQWFVVRPATRLSNPLVAAFSDYLDRSLGHESTPGGSLTEDRSRVESSRLRLKR